MDNSGNWHELDIKKVIKNLNSNKEGLSEFQISKRLARYGPNVIKSEKKISRLTILLSQFKSILVIILIVAAAVSAFVLNSYIDSVVIMIIVIINGIVGYVQEYRAEKAVEALKRMTNPEAIVFRDGKRKKTPSSDIVPGDVVFLEEGTRIPADMRLMETVNLKIDEAALTGESAAVTKSIEPVKNVPLSDRKCMAYMGTMVTYGRGKAIITSTGMDTEIGRIAHMIEDVEDEMTPLQKRLDLFGKRLAIIILVISVLVAAIVFMRSGDLFGGGDPQKSAILVGIALAIAVIPEGLPAIVTVTMALGLRRLSKKNALIRRLPAVETLGSTSVICSDKTGTLTRNEMTVRKVYSDGQLFEVTGRGYKTEGGFLLNAKKINPMGIKSLAIMLRSAVLCNNASLGEKNSIVGDPTEGALIVAAAKGLDIEAVKKQYPRKWELPFSSERKRMSTINQAGKGLESYVKGAPEVILERCTHIYKKGKIFQLSRKEKDAILKINYNLAQEALRILGFAFKKVSSCKEKDAENGLVFLGLMGMIDPPRKDVKELVLSCDEAGIKVVMITGDHKNTAMAIARELHIFKEGHKALTGQELDYLNNKELEKVVENVTVYARVNPEHKMRIVDALRKRHTVAMTGDGVNDAPALKKADIGVAMGIKGTDVAKESSDMVLRDDNFSTIVAAVEEGRAIYDNIKKFIQYLLSSNLGEVGVILFALLMFYDPVNPANVIVPVTVIQLLWINLLTDGLPATALGLDPPAPGIMERPPRNPKENILNRDMLIDILIVGIIITIGTLFVFSLNLPLGEPMARTAAFTALVVFEMVRVQSVRIKFGMRLFDNKKLWLAIGLTMILQLMVIYVPFMQQEELFGTVALGLVQWGQIIIVAFVLMVIMEIKRMLERK